jgi:hypothetical protein
MRNQQNQWKVLKTEVVQASERVKSETRADCHVIKVCLEHPPIPLSVVPLGTVFLCFPSGCKQWRHLPDQGEEDCMQFFLQANSSAVECKIYIVIKHSCSIAEFTDRNMRDLIEDVTRLNHRHLTI